ncbi:translation initiation factor IF-5A [Picrophilus oshimae]|uniref:Translation initiation factor 5A n=2 Tax=Picrophilus torridus (strain ATCC 700027 / DSM 9790 / JCM 10055 / NBRC 100828 / KAW 2/3) TaxID=1122961 RepID=IF5A_PICTO|nr:translation initiation factor IF-5A [Picrophilus oshimae]Q6L150.1 RecName: Full=Translation initiation factor 5A; AltName: Full=Hypusine-containing protein; AltName: Full=eIF-5A [Picrophilus oshimae DSM 9789]AAT43302.1 protein translation initiation factor 5A [Picrophilus oshimae DSM 9789]SMD30390.1 translation initiation factor 5A precursor (eIF-5A) [Picrophilus oshimae DSM 9789]
MSWTEAEVRELKVGRYILIDDSPCRIVDITMSKPGKHGEAKGRIVAIGVFDNQKHSVVYPVKHKVKVPVITKKNAQVLSIANNEVQLMDSETFETFVIPVDPADLEKIKPGMEVPYWEAMGQRKIMLQN